MCVCVLKKDDISIDWSSWSVVGSIALSKLWLEYGLSSSQIRINNVRNVVLLLVDPSSIHHYIFWVWPILSPCSHDGGSPVIWKFRWVVVEPISSILSSPWLMSNIKLVLETCASISSCSVHEVSVWMKEVTSSVSRAIDASCRREFEKDCFCFLWNLPKLVTHMCEVLYGLIGWPPPFYMCFLAHQATNWFVQGEEVPS